jgi:hypothetical protein
MMYIFAVTEVYMKAGASIIFILFTLAGYSQNTINNYKYVLVPAKFDFSKYEDQYGLNVTTKLLLEKKGFIALKDNESLPLALAANKCNALKADVLERNGLFVTRLTLLLRDCQGNIVFKSKEGKSSEKEYPVAYDGALRDAFTSLDAAPYKYDSTQLTQPQQVAATPALPTPSPAAPLSTPAAATPAASDITGTLYAQPTPNGYQLVDTTPKKIITLLKTSVQDYFIADAGGKNGIVFKRNGEWFFERYEDNKLVSQKLDIKF